MPAGVARAVRDFEEIASVGLRNLSAVLYEYGPRRYEPEACTDARAAPRSLRLVTVVVSLADYGSEYTGGIYLGSGQGLVVVPEAREVDERVRAEALHGHEREVAAEVARVGLCGIQIFNPTSM